MRVKLKDIRPNPFRDFDLYPIDEEQVRRLQQSMDSLGFFSGVTLRRADGGFEMAAGHHRKQAAENASFTEIEAVVEPYTDAQMVEIMMIENMTQRGHNAASELDSVAAYCRIIAKDVLLGEGPTSKILEVDNQLAQNQSKIAKHGPGMELLYRAMNGFSKEDRKVNKDAENITSSSIDQALSTLKNSGVMGRLMGEVYAEVEEIRAERAEAERLEREVEQARIAKAEADRVAEEARHERELKRRQEAEVAAEKRRDEAATRDAKERAEAAANAEKRRQERIAAEKALARQREADAKAREEAKKAKEEKAKAAAVEAEKLRKEREAIKAQKARDAIYDPACAHVFRLASHERAFQNFVLSDNGRRFIPKKNQWALAKQIRAEIDHVEREKSVDLGSVTITSMLNEHLSKLIGMQKQIDRDERLRLEREQSQRHVEQLWKNLRHAVATAEGALTKIVKAQKEWAYDKALFPMHLDDIDRLIDAGERMAKLKKALGY